MSCNNNGNIHALHKKKKLTQRKNAIKFPFSVTVSKYSPPHSVQLHCLLFGCSTDYLYN